MSFKHCKLAIALAGAVMCASPALADATWTFGGINPPNAPVTIASKKFAEWVTERTEGRVTVNFFEGSQLGSGPAQIEAMANGAQDGYISSGSNASNLLKEFGVIDIPFLFQSQKHFETFMASDIVDDLKQRLIDEFNIRILADNWMRSPRVFLTRDACVTGPADIAGKRARSPNLPMFVSGWEAIGTVPVTVAYGEAYMALKQGLVDMTESAGEQIFSSKFYEVLPYVTEAEMMFLQNSVYITESSYQAISEEDREIVRQAAIEAGEYFTEMVEENLGKEREQLKAEGVTFCDLPEDGRKAFRAMVEKAVPELEKDGLLPVGWWGRINDMR